MRFDDLIKLNQKNQQPQQSEASPSNFWKKKAGIAKLRIVKTTADPDEFPFHETVTNTTYRQVEGQLRFTRHLSLSWLFNDDNKTLCKKLVERETIDEGTFQKFQKYGDPWAKVLPLIPLFERNGRGGLSTEYILQVIDKADGKLYIMQITKTIFNQLTNEIILARQDGIDLINPDNGFDMSVQIRPSRNKKGLSIDSISFDRKPSKLELRDQDLYNITDVIAGMYWPYEKIVENIVQRVPEVLAENNVQFSEEGKLVSAA